MMGGLTDTELILTTFTSIHTFIALISQLGIVKLSGKAVYKIVPRHFLQVYSTSSAMHTLQALIRLFRITV